ncbi:precorrin-8X methylmutase [Oscillospiraceae bacterium MB08-C2-2]|nr:precorrin-8X methylmutase [Oscillospiraceae bacterium MB08-C2-2]
MEIMKPEEIERRSMEIISEELGDYTLDEENEAVIKRVIHTTADFDFADILEFSPYAVSLGIKALRRGAAIITDTQMARAGINKKAAGELKCPICCYMNDLDVAKKAEEEQTTRAKVSMDKAASLWPVGIYVVGNAPTALIRLHQLIEEEKIFPPLIVGVPVGFVNVVESKELILQSKTPYIVSRGRKGGSTVAAAIINAMLYQAAPRDTQPK